MTQHRLLLVEDERNVGQTLVDRLLKEGFAVSWAKSVEEAKLELKGHPFDLALLDVGLPDGSGFDVAEILRKNHRGTALMFLTAYGDPEDRVRGLELGAEDYVVKPFHVKELILRIQNGLKRASVLKADSSEVKLGRARVHFDKYEMIVDGVSQSLTQKECALLKLLVDRRGAVVSRDEILNFVWSDEEYPSSRTVDNFIMRLRKWIETDPENPTLIKSVRGVGYQLTEEGK